MKRVFKIRGNFLRDIGHGAVKAKQKIMLGGAMMVVEISLVSEIRSDFVIWDLFVVREQDNLMKVSFSRAHDVGRGEQPDGMLPTVVSIS